MHIAAHREPSTATMRAEAPAFTPGASAAEVAPLKVTPPPGLSADFDSADTPAAVDTSLISGALLEISNGSGMGQCATGWIPSPASTAIPSPAMSAVSGMTSSPWSSPFLDSSCKGFHNDWSLPFPGLALPEASVPPPFSSSAHDAPTDFAVEQEAFEFKLQGMEDLQKSVASLIAGLSSLPVGSAMADGEGGCMDTRSTSAGTTTEDSPPPTPLVSEGFGANLSANGGHDDVFAEEDVFIENDLLAKPKVDGEPTSAEVTVRASWAVVKAAAASTAEVAGALSKPVPVTTVTLKNVPRSYTREVMIKRLVEAGFQDEFDFLYLPADFGKNGGGARKGRTCSAAGHATVNFRTEEARERFEAAFHKANAKKAFPGAGGAKACEVALAPVQGKDANVQKLQNSGLLMSLLAERPEWLPALFDGEGELEPFVTDPAAN